MNICVYGASSALLKNIYYEKTEELGRAMGKRGHGLVFGGGATGIDVYKRQFLLIVQVTLSMFNL